MYFKSLSEFKEHLNNTTISSNEQLMILVGESFSHYIEEISALLNKKNINFFGGIYPRLLVGDRSLSEGFIVKKFEPIYSSIVFPNMMEFKLDLQILENSTALLLVDGLSSKVKNLIDTVYNKLGNKPKYIGGGAGYFDMTHRACIFNKDGIFKDALYICIVKADVKLAVKHGWKKLDGPYVITESRENILVKLDEYDAFDIYKDIIQEHENIFLCKEDFYIYAKDHPFGIQKDGQFDFVVRDPISVNENNEIVCVADLPTGANLYILKGNIDSLLSSSHDIANYCASNAPDVYTPLLFNCISRAMFLGDKFEDELKNIQDKLKYQVFGALSIGEFSSRKNGEIIIHNKSTILGLLE